MGGQEHGGGGDGVMALGWLGLGCECRSCRSRNGSGQREREMGNGNGCRPMSSLNKKARGRRALSRPKFCMQKTYSLLPLSTSGSETEAAIRGPSRYADGVTQFGRQ